MASAATQTILSKGPAVLASAVKVAQAEKSLIGVVVSSGRMQRAVKVRTTKQRFDSFLQRHYRVHPEHLVSDPTDSLRTGDVVRIQPWRKSKRIGHVVTEIIKPFGPAITDRPPIGAFEDLVAAKAAKKEAKLARRAIRQAEAEAASAAASEPAAIHEQGAGEEAPVEVDQKTANTTAQGLDLGAEAKEIDRSTEKGVSDLENRTAGIKL